MRDILLLSFLVVLAQSGSIRNAYNQRAMAYLTATALSNDTGTYSDLARLALGMGTVSGAGIESSIQNMNNRLDCSDFDVPGMVRIMWEHSNSPMLPASLKSDITNALLNWQYWIDEYEPLFQGNMMFWTENHQMDFHVSEYLAGALWPTTLFPGTNMTGQQHMDKGRNFVNQWLTRRYRWGHSEWKSDDYLQFQLRSVSTLAALAPEADIQLHASMVLDMLLYDLSVHNYANGVASSRGRSYASAKWNQDSHSVATVIYLLKGQGYQSIGDGAAISIALDTNDGNYEIPEVVLSIAGDYKSTIENRERIGVATQEAALANETGGLGYTTADDGIGWWGEEAYATPETIGLAFAMGDAWDLYDSNETTWNYFKYLRPLWEDDPDLVRTVCELMWPGSSSVLGNASTYIYRTPYGALASALDYHPGVIAFQQHVWQATLPSPTAVIFTTQPGPNFDPDLVTPELTKELLAIWKRYPPHFTTDAPVSDVQSILKTIFAARSFGGVSDPNDVDYSDGYWTGSASMPRLGQYQNLLILLYNPPWNGEPVALFPNRTHAYFPRAEFDVVQDSLNATGWIFAQEGDGYIGMYTSSNNITWVTTGDYANKEILAEGALNAWICVIGNAASDQSFDAFVKNLNGSVISVKKSINTDNSDLTTIDLAIKMLNGNEATFGWNAPLVITPAGKSSFSPSLKNDLRYDGPYISAPFPARDLYFKFNSSSLFLDFDKNLRIVEDADN